MITILLVISFICFLVAAFNVPSSVNLVAAGLAFLVASMLVGSKLFL